MNNLLIQNNYLLLLTNLEITTTTLSPSNDSVLKSVSYTHLDVYKRQAMQ